VQLGWILRIKVLLALGRTSEVRDAFADMEQTLDKDKKPNWGFLPEVGLPAYAWFEIVAAATTGDYAAADKVLANLLVAAKREQKQRLNNLGVSAGVALMRNAADQFGIQTPLNDVIQSLLTPPEMLPGGRLGALLERPAVRPDARSGDAKPDTRG